MIFLCQEKTNAIEQIKEELFLKQQDNCIKTIDEQNDVSNSDSGIKNRENKKKSNSDIKTGENHQKRLSKPSLIFLQEQNSKQIPFLLEIFKDQTNPDCNDFVPILLTETATTILFNNKSFYCQTENQELFQEVVNKQTAYHKVVSTKVGNDNFIDHSVKTYIVAQKHCETQTDQRPIKESGAQIDSFDIDKEINSDSKSTKELEMAELMLHIQKELEANISNPFCMVQTDLESIIISSHGNQNDLLDEKKKIQNMKQSQKVGTKLLNDKGGVSSISSMKLQNNIGLTGANIHQENVAKNSKANNSNPDPLNKTSNLGKSNSYFQKTNQKSTNETFNDLNSSFRNLNKQQLLEREIKKFKEDLKGPLEHLILSENEHKIYHNDLFKNSLSLIEKVILQTTKKANFLTYCNQVSVEEESKGKNGALKPSFLKRQRMEDSEKEQVGSLKNLFSFKFQKVENQNVNVLQYNSWNNDLIAAGYGNARIVENKSSKGTLALWTSKNFNVPLRHYESDSPIMSLQFSKSSPNLLAAGTMKGSLKIYDIRRKTNLPIMCSDDLDELKHLESILEVDWIAKSQGRDDSTESLVSISSDGKLLEWTMKKTLEVSELKQITQSTNPYMKDQSELHSHNFRYSGGFSFDFNKKDPNIYIIATEDGIIHKCSKSYKEQYLESYYSHSGPIYRVRNNPFHQDVFLSCSADWSVRVWNSKSETPMFVLKSLDLFDEVLDCKWNPNCSTSFASACKDGRVEVWDLAFKNLDPIYTLPSDNKSKTCLEFSEKNPVMIIGNEFGEFECFRIHGYENMNISEAKQKEALDRIINLNYKTHEESQGPGGN